MKATHVHPIQSFWMGGFEGADHLNMHGHALDMVRVSGHDKQVDEDYARLRRLGLCSVRESLGWRAATSCGKTDFSRALRFAAAANRHGIQLLWTLMHYGTPPEVSLMEDSFCERFADFAAMAARALGPYSEWAPVYTPINEISYLAWAVCETNAFQPYVGDRRDPRNDGRSDGFMVKRRLVKATLLAMEAIRAEDPRARFLHIDPVVHVVAPADATRELRAESKRFREFQWQAWDMIAGRIEPELGGTPQALDLVGLNHYHNAQWEFGTGRTLDWLSPDPRRLPFRDLLQETWRRYRRPIVVAETGHVDADRGRWLLEIAAEVEHAIDRGVPIESVCLYPIVGRPDWNDEQHWHRSGLWDATSPSEGAAPPRDASGWSPQRHLDEAYAAALSESRLRNFGPTVR